MQMILQLGSSLITSHSYFSKKKKNFLFSEHLYHAKDLSLFAALCFSSYFGFKSVSHIRRF